MTAIDPATAEFKRRVEAEWAIDETAAAWQKHYPRMKEQLAEVTGALIDAARPTPGEKVLDLASGTGEPAIPLAKAVAPAGAVTAADLSAPMLAALCENAAAAGVTNIRTQVCDATELPFPDSTYDLVTSRFGVMFFSDVACALAEVRRVLRPHGRITVLAWGPPAPSTYFGASVMPYMRRLPEPAAPDGPGPMRFAEPGKLARLVEAAGFTGVREERPVLPAPYHGTPEELLTSLMEIATPLRNAVAGLSEADRRAADEDALANLRASYAGEYVRVTAAVVIITASAV